MKLPKCKVWGADDLKKKKKQQQKSQKWVILNSDFMHLRKEIEE